MPIPSPPVLGYSFTGNSTNNPTSQQPGTHLDAEYNRTNQAVGDLIHAVSVSTNADGTLKSSAVQAALDAAVPPGNPGDGSAENDPPAALSAQLAQAWAEHMPDTIPPDVLAITNITGDHWSSRWWANQAAIQYGETEDIIYDFSSMLSELQDGGVPGVPLFSETGSYSAQTLVAHLGIIYRAKAPVAPGTFNPAQWDQITGTTPWVPSLPLAGGTMTGPLALAADPTAPSQAATKTYVDATAGNVGIAAGVVAGHNTGRNRLDNGWFEIQQRGTGPWGTPGFGPDRWTVWAPSTLSFAVQAQTPGLYGGRFALTLAAALSVGTSASVVQRIGSGDSFDLVGQSVTVSFYVAASTDAGVCGVGVQLGYPTNGQNDFSAVTFLPAITVAKSGRVQATFMNLPAGFANGLELAISVFQNTANGNTSMSIGGVQMEVGTAATALEKRAYPDEQARCQRYYQTLILWGAGYAVAGCSVGASGSLPVTMRVTPAVAALTTSNTNIGAPTVAAASSGVIYAYGPATATGFWNITMNLSASAEL